MSKDSPDILEYFSHNPRTHVSFFKHMMQWRTGCGGFYCLSFWCVVISIWAMHWPTPLAWIVRLGMAVGFIGTGLCAMMTLVYLFACCKTNMGIAYAIRQLVFALLLMPFLLLGVFAVPNIVRSDLIKQERLDSSFEGDRL